MSLRAYVFTVATSLRLVVLRASDKDARRISTYIPTSGFSALRRFQREGNP